LADANRGQFDLARPLDIITEVIADAVSPGQTTRMVHRQAGARIAAPKARQVEIKILVIVCKVIEDADLSDHGNWSAKALDAPEADI
jgi:hypothetical protein